MIEYWDSERWEVYLVASEGRKGIDEEGYMESDVSWSRDFVGFVGLGARLGRDGRYN